jgi:hypothetical protein
MPRVQQKRGTAANLTSVDPTPAAGEFIVVSDENTLVIGNGTGSYTSLAYVTATPRDGSVTTAKIADDAVTYAKLQNVSATDRLLGRSSAGAGDVEEITCTAFGRSLIDDADAAAARTTLGAAPAASPTFSGVITASIGSVGGSLTQTPTATSGESIRLVSSATAGNGNYGAQIAWSRLGDGNGRRAAIGSVQTAADQDQVGLAFFAHADASATVELYEAMRLTHDGLVGVATSSPTAKLDVNANTMRLRTARTPASAGATGNAGDICWDADYLYVCTATNTWRRIAHSTW